MKMKELTNNSGFTLLEIIIVIIIVGVLASLALPRFFSTVEYSRSTEALVSLSAIRVSMERCYFQNSATYVGCNSFANLDLENPANSPNSHFGYTWAPLPTKGGYTLVATRNTRDGGAATSIITLVQSTAGVVRSGASAFLMIK